MLGCIQPISSPMMKRILGFCPWAEAGTLAIVVAAHNAARAPQITLNMLFPFLECRLPKPGPQPSPVSTHQPSLPAESRVVMLRGNAGRPGAGEIGRDAQGCAMRFRQLCAYVQITFQGQ